MKNEGMSTARYVVEGALAGLALAAGLIGAAYLIVGCGPPDGPGTAQLAIGQGHTEHGNGLGYGHCHHQGNGYGHMEDACDDDGCDDDFDAPAHAQCQGQPDWHACVSGMGIEVPASCLHQKCRPLDDGIPECHHHDADGGTPNEDGGNPPGEDGGTVVPGQDGGTAPTPDASTPHSCGSADSGTTNVDAGEPGPDSGSLGHPGYQRCTNQGNYTTAAGSCDHDCCDDSYDAQYHAQCAGQADFAPCVIPAIDYPSLCFSQKCRPWDGENPLCHHVAGYFVTSSGPVNPQVCGEAGGDNPGNPGGTPGIPNGGSNPGSNGNPGGLGLPQKPELNREGFGCTMGGSDATGGFLGVLVAGMVLLASVRRKSKKMLVGAILMGLGSSFGLARAQDQYPLHLNADFMYQMAPADQLVNPKRTEHRLGGEIGLQASFFKYLDAGLAMSVGENLGARVVGTLHTDRTAHRVNPFFQPRFIIHPVGGVVGTGLGAWAGATIEAGPGRFEFGPAAELFSSPENNSYRSIAFLLLAGYQFDLFKADPPKCTKTSCPMPKRAEPAPVAAAEPPAAVLTEDRIEILENVLFYFDTATVKPESTHVLDDVAKIMNDHPELQVRICGHTCDLGTEKYNQGLSERRAAAVEKYLVEHGIEAGRLTSEGFGLSQPAFPNVDEPNRAKNRRVEFILVK